ncbi:MAG TPA: hypothetical protein PK353_12085 [Saprospiraceae bacterium]|nr:hypothetical protein [Saprospiraceae bacterium]
MNFQLKDLHLHFDKLTMAEAEMLITSGDLQKISEIQKNVWQLKFDYENVNSRCELNTSGKVKKYSCSCVVFSLYKKCKHVAALCMLIQKIKLNAGTKDDNPLNRTVRSISLGKILKHTSHIELTNFLLDYTKTSPELSALLKARFLFNFPEEITLENDPILTAQINRLLQSKRPAENTLFDIYKSLDAYFVQAIRKIDQHETLAAFNILSIISKNLNKLIVQYQADNEKLLGMSIKLYNKLADLNRLFVAPEAKNQLSELLLEGRELTTTITNTEWHEKYIEVLLLNLSNNSDFQNIKDELFNKYFKQIRLIENRSAWIMFDIQSDVLCNVKPEPTNIATNIGEDIDLLRSLLTRLIPKLHYELASKLITQCCKQYPTYFSTYTHELNSIQLEMAVRTHNWKKAEKLLLSDFPHNPDGRVLLYIKEAFPTHFEEISNKLSQIKLPDTEQQLLLEMVLSEVSGDYLAPMNTIIASNDIRLLVKYDHLFWKKNPEETVELYKTLSKLYLETHFGEPAQTFIHDMFQHLENNKRKEEVRTIRKFLNPLFSKRMAINTKIKYPAI